MFNEVYKNSKVRKPYNQIIDWANSLPENVIVKKKNEAESLFKLYDLETQNLISQI